jgi:hypothetical protein
VLEKARLTFFLDSANGDVELFHESGTNFRAIFLACGDNEKEFFLNCTVGGRVLFVQKNSQERMLVTDVGKVGHRLCVHLQYLHPEFLEDPSGPPGGPPSPESFVYGASGIVLYAKFLLCKLPFMIKETAVIDAWTAHGERWFDGNNLSLNGTPLVRSNITCCAFVGVRYLQNVHHRGTLKFALTFIYHFHQISSTQLDRLLENKGYVGSLSIQQRPVVINMLRHKPARSIQAVLGASGTGKTFVLDEVIMQVLEHNEAPSPGDAL